MQTCIYVARRLEQSEAYDAWREGLAAERLLLLAIETVTDIGSALIDGFIMRDPGSYEDIVDILLDENVIDNRVHSELIRLVQLRKPLMRQFIDWPREKLHPFISALPVLLDQFHRQVSGYMERELA